MDTYVFKREVEAVDSFRSVGVDDNRNIQQARNTSIAVLHFYVVQPTTLHIDKRFVELLRDDDEHQTGKNGEFTALSPPRTRAAASNFEELFEIVDI